MQITARAWVARAALGAVCATFGCATAVDDGSGPGAIDSGHATAHPQGSTTDAGVHEDTGGATSYDSSIGDSGVSPSDSSSGADTATGDDTSIAIDSSTAPDTSMVDTGSIDDTFVGVDSAPPADTLVSTDTFVAPDTFVDDTFVAPPDTGTIPDVIVHADATCGSPVSALPGEGTSCTAAIPIDMDLGCPLTFLGDTCSAPTVSTSCGAGQGMIYAVSVTSKITLFSISVSPGFELATIPGPPLCGGAGGCVGLGYATGVSPGTTEYWTVLKSGGGCGTYVLTVTPS